MTATPGPDLPRRGLLLGAVGSALLAGCALGPQVADYESEPPALDLARYFDGPLAAQGLFADRFGRVRRRFTVAMQARWQGDEGVLAEDFVYLDGEKSRRVWRLKRLDGGRRWEGRADDVVGVATGEVAGHALRWQYTLLLPISGRTWKVDVDDWMHLVDERHMLNRARFSLWGVTLGEVQLAFQKPDAPGTGAAGPSGAAGGSSKAAG